MIDVQHGALRIARSLSGALNQFAAYSAMSIVGTHSRIEDRSPDAVVCERCSEEMFRMHAVWRCPRCGYKTDCCGW